MNKRPFVIKNDLIRARCAAFILDELPEGWHVVAQEPTRNLSQNAAQWPILEQFAKQRQWPVNGEMCWLTDAEWKDILTAAFENETRPRLASGIDGGVVMLGQRTSKFSVKRFSEWLEFLHATAAVLGVKVS